jgi:hypothetical protein
MVLSVQRLRSKMTGDGQSGQKETKNLIRFAGDNVIKVE